MRYLCTRNQTIAQMAESVDALVSNTSGATHPGSIPGLGTETEKVEKLSPFSFSIIQSQGGHGCCRSQRTSLSAYGLKHHL